MTDTAIRVENLGKKYKLGSSKSGDFRESLSRLFRKPQTADRRPVSDKEFWALKDVSFEIKQGEAVGIIGRNGAGKSTLLKILSRITEPTTGRFEIFGRVSSLLEVGTGFHEELTGRENIYLNGTILGMRRAEIKTKFDEIVAFSGVEKFIDTPVKHYSSGMKVRLAFAVAAHLEPEILIIDEVLAVGDAEFQKKCLGKMEDVTQRGGRTVIFVSHNMGAVKSLCKKGIFLENGTVKLISSANEAVQEYLSGYDSIPFVQESFHREGSQNVNFKNIRFLNEFDEEQHNLITGQKLLVELEYTSGLDEIRNVMFGISIYNSQNQFITVLNNGMSNHYFKKLPGTGKVYCCLEKLPLMGGLHIMDVNLYVNGTQEETIKEAKKFNVENKDYYDSGFPNFGNRQGIYIEQQWKTYSTVLEQSV